MSVIAFNCHLVPRIQGPIMRQSSFVSRVRSVIFGGLASIALLLSVGCQKAVTIEYPAKGESKAPVSTFRVRFDKDFKPGTFRATLNGETITNKFLPSPAPGAVSNASSDYMEAPYDSLQVLHVEGLFKNPTSGLPPQQNYDDVEFSPPSIFVHRGNTSNSNLDVTERETIAATVVVLEVPRGEGLTVTLTTDENSAVSLNNAPAGTPITVTIPNNDRRADFTIRGIEAGKSFHVRPLAHGYAWHVGSGTVFSIP